MKKSFEIDMSEGKLAPKIIAFSLPVMLSGLLQLAFNAADLIVVGRFANSNALAAVGSTSSLVHLLVNLLLGFGTGTSVLVARYFGAKDEKSLLDTVRTSVLVAILGGLLFGIIAQILCVPLLKLMDSPADVLPLSALYLRIYFAGLPVIALYNFSSAALRAVGDSRRPLLYLTVAGILNVILNLFFVIVCKMDVDGVALATVLSQCLSCYLTVRCLVRSKTICRLELTPFRISGTQLKNLMRLGIPAGIQSSLFSVANVTIQSSVNYFGPLVMAGNSASSNIEGFVNIMQDAFAQGAVAAISQNMGARNYDRARKTVRLSFLFEFAVSSVMLWLVLPMRRTLISFYTPGSEEAIAAGCTRLFYMGILYYLNGTQNMMGGIMRAHGYSLLPTVVALTCICGFRLIWIYTVFAKFRTLMMLYITYPISWGLMSAILIVCYIALRKRSYVANEQFFIEESSRS